MTDSFDRLDACVAPETPNRTWEELRTHPDTQVRNASLRTRHQTSLQSHRLGAVRYHASEALRTAINTALALEMPLLIAGRPGTGKTQVAWFIAAMFGLDEPFRVTVRSDATQRDLLYDFDAVGDFRDAQEVGPSEYGPGAASAPLRGSQPIRDRSRHIKPRALWRALVSEEPCVVLIDEIDKAPRDLPNDLLAVLNDYEFEVPELDRCTGEQVAQRFGDRVRRGNDGVWRVEGDPEQRRPIVVITTNSERRLPEPFLRRCVFHYIDLDEALVHGVVKARREDPDLGSLSAQTVDTAVRHFMSLAHHPELRKPPSIPELLSWLQLLGRVPARQAELDNPVGQLPFLSVLVKTQEDLMVLDALSSPA